MLTEALGCPCHHISKISRTLVLRLKILSTWLASLVVIVLCPYEVHRGFKSTSQLSHFCHSVATNNFEKEKSPSDFSWLVRGVTFDRIKVLYLCAGRLNCDLPVLHREWHLYSFSEALLYFYFFDIFICVALAVFVSF